MRNIRKAMGLIFVCIFVLSLFPVSASALNEGVWQYELNESGEATITGYTGADTDILVPAEVDTHTVVAIASDAFTDDAITGISIPDCVVSVDSGAFWECRTLKSITFLGDNPNYKSDGGIAFSKDGKTLFHYPANKNGTTYAIPSDVTTIGRCAFDHNQNLINISLTDEITRIEESAFWRCDALTSLTVPKNVSYIGESISANCSKLTGIAVAAGNPAFKSVNGVLFDISGGQLLQYPCGKSGSHYTVPAGVKSIGGGAFRGANGLTDVALSDSVENINSCAFAYCESLNAVKLGNNLKTIGFGAFQACFILQSIVMPQSIESLDPMVFESCEALKNAYFLGNKPLFGENVFQNTASGFILHYYKGCEASWLSYSDYSKKAFCYITFESSGGGTVAQQMADYGGKITKPANPSKPHSDFGGWYKDATLKNAWNFNTDTVASDTKLFAKWVPSLYTIKFYSNKGSAVANQKIQYNGLIKRPKDPVRTGCTLAGWYKDAALKTAWNFTSDRVTGDTNLYAKWKSNGIYAIKTAVNNKRYGKASGAGSYKGGATVRLAAIPSNDYRFVKWMEGKKTVSKVAVYVFDAGKSRTLKACFEKIGVPRIASAVLSGSRGVKIKWSAVSGASGYNIYRASSKSGKYKKIASIGKLASYTDTGLKPGATYYYKVQAWCKADVKITTGSLSSAKRAAIPRA